MVPTAQGTIQFMFYFLHHFNPSVVVCDNLCTNTNYWYVTWAMVIDLVNLSGEVHNIQSGYYTSYVSLHSTKRTFLVTYLIRTHTSCPYCSYHDITSTRLRISTMEFRLMRQPYFTLKFVFDVLPSLQPQHGL